MKQSMTKSLFAGVILSLSIASVAFAFDKTETSELKDLKSVKIKVDATTLNLRKTDKPTPYFEYTYDESLKDVITQKFENGVFDIDISEKNSLTQLAKKPRRELNLYLPDEYKLENISTEFSSSDLVANIILNADNFNVKSARGSLSLGRLNGNLTVDSGSTNIEAYFGKANAKNVFKMRGGYAILHDVYGSINVTGTMDNIQVQQLMQNDVYVNVTAGQASIEIPKTSNYKVHFDSNKGAFKNNGVKVVLTDSRENFMEGSVDGNSSSKNYSNIFYSTGRGDLQLRYSEKSE